MSFRVYFHSLASDLALITEAIPERISLDPQSNDGAKSGLQSTQNQFVTAAPPMYFCYC